MFTNNDHCVKRVLNWSYSVPHFSRIFAGKMRTGTTPNTDTFYEVDNRHILNLIRPFP